MKVGILSVNMHTKGLNFACPVHTYAFQQFLLANQIDSVVLDYKANYYEDFEPRHPSEYYARKCEDLQRRKPATEEERQDIESKLALMIQKRDSYAALYKERETRYDKFQDFIETYYIKTEECYDAALLEVLDPGCDCYICATDVVWKNNPSLGFDRGYLLGSRCMENKWKLSYAASRGYFHPYSDQEEAVFFHYISDIDRISVRETSLKEYIEENSGLQARVVIDPVLFHGREFYEKISVKPQEEHYILFYYAEERSENTLQQVLRCARRYRLKVVELTNLPLREGILKKYKNINSVFRYDIGPDEWIGYIRHADFVFTNSFHATCFSIIFRKKFFVGSRHGDKIAHFLDSIGLSDRMIPEEPVMDWTPKNLHWRLKRPFYRFQDLTGIGVGQPPLQSRIPYRQVEKRLAAMRAESTDFLLSSIREFEHSQRSARDYDSFKRTLRYCIRYNSRLKNRAFRWDWTTQDGTVRSLKSGSYEYTPREGIVANDGSAHFAKNRFLLEGYRFAGWNLRIRIGVHWFWYLNDGTFCLMDTYNKSTDRPLRVFRDEEAVPFLPFNQIGVAVADALWQKDKGE